MKQSRWQVYDDYDVNVILNQVTSIIYDIIKVLNQNDRYGIMMECQYEMDLGKGQYLMGLKINAIERLT